MVQQALRISERERWKWKKYPNEKHKVTRHEILPAQVQARPHCKKWRNEQRE